MSRAAGRQLAAACCWGRSKPLRTPAAGLVGPHDLGANGEVTYPADGEDSFTMVALRDIAAGEEVSGVFYVAAPPS